MAGEDIILAVHYIDSFLDLSGLKVDFAGKKALWGVSPVAPLHLGYDLLFGLQTELAKLGAKPCTLLADVHAMMSHNLSREEATLRTAYYLSVMEALGVSTEVIIGSDFEYSEPYTSWLYTLMQRLTINEVKHAAGSVAKDRRETIDRYVYPLMQCADAIMLAPELVVAERGQEKIYRLLNLLDEHESLSALYPWLSSVDFIYVESAHNLSGERIQRSSRDLRISYHDDDNLLEDKVRRMFAPPVLKQLHDKENSLLEIFKYSIYPMLGSIPDLELPFASYLSLERAYLAGDYHPGDAKAALLKALRRRREWFNCRLPAECAAWINPSFYGGNSLAC
jgi:tyrosyl-tRNA synthetase